MTLFKFVSVTQYIYTFNRMYLIRYERNGGGIKLKQNLTMLGNATATFSPNNNQEWFGENNTEKCCKMHVSYIKEHIIQ